MSSGDQYPGTGNKGYYPETAALLELLKETPEHDFRCTHGDGMPAIGIYEVPGGCVALPGVETQSLCPQHVISNGSFDGMRLIVDLSVGAVWSESRGETPYYFMAMEPGSGAVALVEVVVSEPGTDRL